MGVLFVTELFLHDVPGSYRARRPTVERSLLGFSAQKNVRKSKGKIISVQTMKAHGQLEE